MEQTEVLMVLKLAFMVLFMVIVIFMGTLPLRVKKFKSNKLLRSMGTTFAGALFLNVSIIHILPESADAIETYLKEKSGADEVFPLANLLLMVGFLITIFFTRIIAAHSHDQDHFNDSSGVSSEFRVQPEDDRNKATLQAREENEEEGESNKVALLGQDELDEADLEPEVEEEPPENPPNHQDTYFLTLAMFFHTIFEGIAIGVQDTTGGFLSIAVAIAFHKWADALSMGIQYRSRNIPIRIAYGLIIVQAVLNAAAIGFGWAIDSLGEFVEAIFLSISAGTFLAISTMEMLGQQLHRPRYRLLKFLIMLSATGFISLIWYFENDLFSK